MEPPSPHRIEVVNETHQRFDEAVLRLAIAAALDLQGVLSARVTVLLADDGAIRELNRRFRGIDEETDVLTFPAGEGADGDLAIAVPYAARQAALRGVPLETELAYLAIHGALHLCGLDDATDDEADEMRFRMSLAAVAIGLPPDEHWGSLLHESEAAGC